MKDFSLQTTRELLESEFVTEPTRQALSERLDFDLNYAPQFFDAKDYDTLKAICDALAPSKVVPCQFVAGELINAFSRTKATAGVTARCRPTATLTESRCRFLTASRKDFLQTILPPSATSGASKSCEKCATATAIKCLAKSRRSFQSPGFSRNSLPSLSSFLQSSARFGRNRLHRFRGRARLGFGSEQ